MTEGERERARRNAFELAKSIDEMDAFALTAWLDKCAISDIELIARALLSTSSAVRGMREALEKADEHIGALLRIYEDAPIRDADRARVKEIAAAFGERCLAAALSVEGEDEQAPNQPTRKAQANE